MSQVAYIVTKDVRHLGAWTQDRDQPDSWPTGAQRPICGGKVRPPSDVMWLDFPYENQRKVAQGMARPVCRLCIKALAGLQEAAQS